MLSLLSIAYRPMIDPLPIASVPDWIWYLALPPLLFAVASVYTAIRVWDLRRFRSQVIKLFLTLLIGTWALALIASGLSALVLH